MTRMFPIVVLALLSPAMSSAQRPPEDAEGRLRLARRAAAQVDAATPIAAYRVVDGREAERVIGRRLPGLGRGEMWVERTGVTAVRVPGDTNPSWVLPVRVHVHDHAGKEVTVVPFLTVQGLGLKWVVADGVFRGKVGVTLVEPGESAGGRRLLSEPVTVSFTGEASAYSPRDVRLAQTDTLADVQIETDRFVDKLRVSAFTTDARNPVEIDVPVVEKLHVLPTPKKIQGLGLEVTKLVLIGPPSTTTRKSVMSVTADMATPEPQEVVLDAAGMGTALLRSRGVGSAVVTARLMPAGEANETVTFELPWAFAAAALVGGCLGALIVLFKRWTKPGRPVLVTLGLGILVGFVVAAAYAAGINLAEFKLDATYGEAAVCVFAALGAVAGPKVLRLKPV
ncbi:MAG TPA: hypothetical protein VKE22_05590 [Haliangiales bacterium]|nr:hypothetical protein [Haliangiales bacterium]